MGTDHFFAASNEIISMSALKKVTCPHFSAYIPPPVQNMRFPFDNPSRKGV